MSTHDVYISADDVRSAVGVKTGGDDLVNRVAILGTDWTQWYAGETVTTVPVDAPVTLNVVPASAGRISAALAAAVRFYNSPQAPFGVLGSGDTLAYVSGQRIPEAELAMLGERKAFGIA